MEQDQSWLTLSEGEGRTRIQVAGIWCGRDLTVAITGGTHPHVGAVALGQARPSLKGDGSVSASTSVLTLLGHKEDELARWAAHFLAVRFGSNVVVTAGLHVDNGTLPEVMGLDQGARVMVERWAEKFAAFAPVAVPHHP